MGTLVERIRTAQTYLGVLLQERARLQQQVEALKASDRAHAEANAALRARLAELERENQVLRTPRPAIAVPQRAGTKERIDELVGEIDRCLELLKA